MLHKSIYNIPMCVHMCMYVALHTCVHGTPPMSAAHYTTNTSRGPTVFGPRLPTAPSSPHVLVYDVFLTPCTGLWCVPHSMYWSMMCSSPHVLVYGVFLTPCTGLWCVPHPMYWSMVCPSPHVLVYGVFLTPYTGL